MDLKNHFLLTLMALFSLGVILVRPAPNYYESKHYRDCHLIKGRMDCSLKYEEYQMNSPIHSIQE